MRMRHLEFVHQALRPELDARFTSVTEHRAQFAVAGPKSRDLLNGLLAEPIDNGHWPFMSCGAGCRRAALSDILFRGTCL